MSLVDIDACNVSLSVQVFAQHTVLQLTSVQRKIHMQSFRKRTDNSAFGLRGCVQITESPAFFVSQTHHAALIDALRNRGVFVVRSEYEQFDEASGEGAVGAVPFCLVTTKVDGTELMHACRAADVDTVRLVEFNQKQSAKLGLSQQCEDMKSTI